jgi:hypothetical protein
MALIRSGVCRVRFSQVGGFGSPAEKGISRQAADRWDRPADLH